VPDAVDLPNGTTAMDALSYLHNGLLPVCP
jgi:hypothetical protein